MKVEKTTATFFPFKDHFKKTEKDKKQQEKKNKKPVDVSNKTKEDNFIGWA